MDIKNYIASGILEQYVLGLVSEKDRKEIEQYMLQHPEIKREVDSIEKAMELYAEGSKMKPSEGLEAKILKEIENTPREFPSTGSSGSGSGFHWLPMILGVLLIGAAILSGYFYNQNNQTLSELETQRNDFQTLQDDCNEKDENLRALNEQLEILINTGNEPFPMNKDGKALAAVFYNSDSQKAYLNKGALPAAPSDRKYELWALVDGVPVSMGQFDINTGDTSLIEVLFIENAGVFAVTLEPLDNDPAPNLAELQVISG